MEKETNDRTKQKILTLLTLHPEVEHGTMTELHAQSLTISGTVPHSEKPVELNWKKIQTNGQFTIITNSCKSILNGKNK